MAQEIFYFMHKSKSNNGFAVIKINLDETYNIVQWDFLEVGVRKGFVLFFLYITI